MESQLLVLTNRQRESQGLPPLTVDENLVRIARDHSSGMAQQGFISHDQPSGNLDARMNRGRYWYEVARENVAVARTIFIADLALMNSPAHRRNILADDVNRVGIGIIRCAPPFENELYITEIFATPREEYKTSSVHEVLRDKIDDLRLSGFETLQPDPMLENLASTSVETLSFPYQRQELRDLLTSSANELRKNGRTKIGRVDASVQVLRDPKNVRMPIKTQDGQEVRMFGTAVREVLDTHNQPAFLVLTLIAFSN